MGCTEARLSGKGCWTCKDRRVRCDRQLPECRNCVRVNRSCQGYGVRLSWPRQDDRRRAIVSNRALAKANTRDHWSPQFVHTSVWDIELYYHLTSLKPEDISNEALFQPHQFIRPVLSLRNTFDMNTQEAGLLQYFNSVAFSTLVTFTTDSTKLRDSLLRMAMSDDSPSSRATRKAILAVSSLFRDGLQVQAAQLKIAALKAMALSAKNNNLGPVEAAQHIAAGMLLCSFEIQYASDTAGQWIWYVAGAKDIINASIPDHRHAGSEIASLLHWIHYHDVISRFSILHWRHGPIRGVYAKQLVLQDETAFERGPCATNRPLLGFRDGPHEILSYLSNLFDLLMRSLKNGSLSDIDEDELRELERKVRSLPKMADLIHFKPTVESDNASLVVEFYRVAALAYISRVCEAKLREPRDLTGMLDHVFALLDQIPTFEKQFPLFVLACEAGTDERRMAIMNLVERTERTTPVRDQSCFKQGLKAIWVQEDLHADEFSRLDYMHRLSGILSAGKTLPSLV